MKRLALFLALAAAARAGTPGQPPVAQDDAVFLPVAAPVSIAVLANDSDPEGGPLTLESVTQGAAGNVVIVGNQIAYSPLRRFAGSDTFSYEVRDNSGQTATATVRVTTYAGIAGLHGGALTIPAGTNPVTPANGFLRVSLGRRGLATGVVTFHGVRAGFSGALDANGRRTFTLRPVGLPEATLALAFDTSGATFGATGTLTTAAGAFPVAAARAIQRPERDAFVGRYTVNLQAPGSATVPGGEGWGLLEVSRFVGSGVFRGRLADGAPFSSQGIVDPTGKVAIYSLLYRKPRGSLAGQLTIESRPERGGADDRITSTGLVWGKPAQLLPDPRYLAGFTTTVAVAGARYTPPAPGGVPLVLPISLKADLRLSAGNLIVPFTRVVTFQPPARIFVDNPNFENAIFSYAGQRGLFGGGFNHPVDTKRTRLSGVFRQDLNQGRGFFLGATQSGSVLLTPQAPPLQP